ncbi:MULTISPECIES: glycosyltransferase family 2 protein [unclassified Paenibacillus]|uniref:glycosyltransferase family 2 protein n=1 Tax=unclassified Paenibacillus TaxID=185978 RepID=UPI000953F430|nr:MULTISPECIES: glycosyltransferase family 2 protein [unclassified Paenibacillus]ASS67231.1 glycosyltransferase family 2 protein [Paenibacillus sp. RUD330]SIQ84887.1 Glycosyltransferase involved in cell wall bisynthesis [Paenibacillus sp. RU4X]SIR05712.1 Glycosyltransferase involved in cell wall bisynthesis [Paenibacillus sp. RU4T]
MRKQLALVMIVKNGEATLGRCLESVRSHVDEIIVVDTGSIDRTKQIAQDFGADVFDFQWGDSFAEARNYALSRSSAEWKLILDADEYVVSADWEEIRKFMENAGQIGRIRIDSDFVNGEGENSQAGGWVSRLLPGDVRYAGRIHEQAQSDAPRRNIPLLVNHDGYKGTDKSSRNIPLLLMEYEAEGTSKSYYAYQLGKEYYGIKNYAEASRYLKESLGRLHGREPYAPNVVVHYLYALIGLGDLDRGMELVNQSHEYTSQFPDYYFACGIFYMDYIMAEPSTRVHLLPRIEHSYLKAIAIGDSDRYDSVKGTGTDAAQFNLGLYYELSGQAGKAAEAYRESARHGNEKAQARLDGLNR